MHSVSQSQFVHPSTHPCNEILLVIVNGKTQSNYLRSQCKPLFARPAVRPSVCHAFIDAKQIDNRRACMHARPRKNTSTMNTACSLSIAMTYIVQTTSFPVKNSTRTLRLDHLQCTFPRIHRVSSMQRRHPVYSVDRRSVGRSVGRGLGRSHVDLSHGHRRRRSS